MIRKYTKNNASSVLSIKKKLLVYPKIRLIKQSRTKNLLRGIIANQNSKSISHEKMNAVRKEALGLDLANAITIILGRNGCSPLVNTGATYRSLLRSHQLNEISTESEVYFTIGHLNGWPDEVREILGAFEMLSSLPTTNAVDALEALLVVAERWGASNYLAKKIAYVASKEGKNPSLADPLSRIAEVLDQRKYSAPFFTAMEEMDSEFDYFSSISNRVQLLSKYVKNDFRQILPLHNIVPVPLSIDDIAMYLRKAHSMSLIDEVVALVQIFHLRHQWPSIIDIIEKTLDSEILKSIKHFIGINFDASKIYDDVDVHYADITYYRRSSAFTEFREPCEYRSFTDKIISRRLLPNFPSLNSDLSQYPQPNVKQLTTKRNGFRKPTDYQHPQNVGTFLRTLWFLLYLEKNKTLSALTHSDIRAIFNATSSLDILLTEIEIERLYATSNEESRPLITVLALALYKARSNDEDVDFKFRLSLSQNIIEKFDRNIVSFINWLLPSSPEVANFLLSVLDRPTLQKMYWLVNSPREADQIRQDILRAVGKARGRLEYFVEADAIEAQSQVSKLQRYFDDSRMYVDGYAMKQWLMDNPSAYAQQYLRLIEHSTDTTGIVKVTIAISGKEIKTEAKALSAFDYMLIEIAKITFEQFCINANFGIESYLGRRIRHNTLTGMMRGGVETLIEKPYYHVLTFDKTFMEAHSKWVEEYRATIENLRKDVLQFRSNQKPKGVFVSELNCETDPTKTNIAILRGMAASSNNSDLFYEMLIRFCWQEVAPQLNTAAKMVTVDILNSTLRILNEYLGGFSGELHRQFQSELQNEVHDRFARLGSWFRQPDSGFVSATTKELGDLIFMEATNGTLPTNKKILWSGNGYEIPIDGLSVHRMYDCLSVLIRNAYKYGEEEVPINVEVNINETSKTSIARLNIKVASWFKQDEKKQENIQRLVECFNEDDIGGAMMREGYSGIKKLRYIVANCEGYSTVQYAISEEICKVSYTLTVELAKNESSI